MSDLIERDKALDCFHDWTDRHGDVHSADEMPEYQAIEALPSAQPKPFGMIEHAGIEHPLSDREIIPRLRDIQAQVGGSYAIDRAIEIMESAKPIVHCRECTNWDCGYKSIINPENHYCVIMDKLMKPDDFCSYGERKE